MCLVITNLYEVTSPSSSYCARPPKVVLLSSGYGLALASIEKSSRGEPSLSVNKYKRLGKSLIPNALIFCWSTCKMRLASLLRKLLRLFQRFVLLMLTALVVVLITQECRHCLPALSKHSRSKLLSSRRLLLNYRSNSVLISANLY